MFSSTLTNWQNLQEMPSDTDFTRTLRNFCWPNEVDRLSVEQRRKVLTGEEYSHTGMAALKKSTGKAQIKGQSDTSMCCMITLLLLYELIP